MSSQLSMRPGFAKWLWMGLAILVAALVLYVAWPTHHRHRQLSEAGDAQLPVKKKSIPTAVQMDPAWRTVVTQLPSQADHVTVAALDETGLVTQASHTLTSSEQQKLVSLLSELSVDCTPTKGVGCHDPAYEISYRQGQKELQNVSLCWKCQSIVLDGAQGGRCRFQSGDGPAHDLRVMLDGLFDRADYQRIRPMLELGEGRAQVQGSLGGSIIRGVIRRHLSELKSCLAPGDRGCMCDGFVYRFRITPNGTVASSEVLTTAIYTPAIEQCVVKAVKRWEFPPPPNGDTVVVDYPLVSKCGGDCYGN